MTISPDMSGVHPIYSCVMAAGPRYAQQTLTFLWTLLDLAEVPPTRILVHALDDADARTRSQIEALGVETRMCAPFRDGFPHCNKLRQLEDVRLRSGEPRILCDTDVAVVHDIDTAMPTTGLSAKVVDLPNPPWEMWQRVLAAAGLALPSSLIHTSFGEHTTPRFNCNGGVYLMRGEAAGVLAEAWPRWAQWLIGRPELLPRGFTIHTDQVAFGLAVWERGVPLALLPLGDNYPTHAGVEPKPDLEPRVLHYHDHVDPSGFLKPIGRPAVDRAIERVNRVIATRRRKHFDNATFWNFRYDRAPELGSGLGSRGEGLSYKRDQLARLVDPGDSVLDVGCGDLEVSRELPTPRYTGVDVSQQALAIARTKRPDWTFVEGQLRDIALPLHDVVICFDVLIHQRTMAAYRSLVADLVRLAGRRLIIGAYDAPPALTSEITFYHEPISTTLGRLVGAETVTVADGYRDAALIVVDMPAAPKAIVERLRQTTVFETVHGRMAAADGDLITSHFRSFGAHTRNELAMLLAFLQPGDQVLDVGGHVGSFAIPMARRVGPEGRVVAVEPDAFNVELLYRNVALGDVDDRVHVTGGVVVGTSGRVRAVATEGNTGAWRFVEDPAGPVASCSLDYIAEATGITRPSLLKIDVEGMELAVLASATRTIEAARPAIYCEVAAEQLARYGTSVDDLDAFLVARGYELFRNTGERNSSHDRFTLTRLNRLAHGGAFFDCLAMPAERVAAFIDAGRLPAIAASASG